MHESIEGFEMPDVELVERVAARLRLLADPTRLRIVCALEQGESDVSCLARLVGVGLPGVSQHLSKLRLAGMVRCERDGQRMVYELLDADLGHLVVDLLADRRSTKAASQARA